MTPAVRLRDVRAEDLPVFYDHQADPAAFAMAGFRPREREAFFSHWGHILEDRTVTTKTVVVGERPAGYVACFEQNGERLVGYWIGRDFWGQGVATRALSLLLDEVGLRPLRARVARDNPGSIRVLEKCGFARIGEDVGPPGSRGEGIPEFLYERDR